jgi:methionyl-tRNA formyltransferase
MSPNQAKPLRLGFAGTPDFAAEHLGVLLEADDHQIVAVWTQPDRPAGRGKQMQASPVKLLALSKNIPVLQPEKLLAADQAEMAALKLDLLVVVAYGLLLPQEVLNTPTYGCINVHASLLPRWRGAAPIQRAIEAGDSETGVCIMQMDAGLDTGDVLSRAAFPIRAIDTAGMVHDRLIEHGAPLLARTINQIAEGSAVADKQDEQYKTYAAKITKAEAEIDWALSALELDRKIRAFNPSPVAYTHLKGDRIRIWQAYALDEQEQKPDQLKSREAGRIFACNTEGIDVACGQGVLRLKIVQLPGKKPTAVDELLRGNADRFQLGSRLGVLKSIAPES